MVVPCAHVNGDGQQQAWQTIAALAAQAQIIDVPLPDAAAGACVRWRCWGEGAPVVLLHGGHGSWLHWIRNIEALAQSRTVWVPDMPSYGDSAPVLGNPQQEQAYCHAIVAGLRQTMDAVLPIGSVDMVGFSFGGLVAGLLAAQQPRVARLALLGPAGHGGPRQKSHAFMRWRGLQGEALDDAMRHNLAANMLYQPSAIDALAVAVHRHSSLHALYRSRTVSRSPMLLQALSGLELPMLLLWGEHDVTALPAVAAQALLQDRPERQWQLFAGVGHWLQYEAAQQLNVRLQQWLVHTH